MSFEIGDQVWLHKMWRGLGIAKRGRVKQQRTNSTTKIKQCLVVSKQIGAKWVDEMYLTHVPALELLAEAAD